MDPSIWWIFLVGVFLLGIFSQVYLLAAFAVMLAVAGVLAQSWQAGGCGRLARRRYAQKNGRRGKYSQKSESGRGKSRHSSVL